MRLSLPYRDTLTFEVDIEPDGRVFASVANGPKRGLKYTVFGSYNIRRAGVERVKLGAEHWPVIMAARDAVLKGDAPCD